MPGSVEPDVIMLNVKDILLSGETCAVVSTDVTGSGGDSKKINSGQNIDLHFWVPWPPKKSDLLVKSSCSLVESFCILCNFPRA